MTLGRSVSSAKCSGDALNERHTGAGSSGVAANIFPPTLKSRSLPHWIWSTAPGKERHNSRSQSTFMSKILGQERACLNGRNDIAHGPAVRSSFPGDLLHRADNKGIRKSSQQCNDRHNDEGDEESSGVIDDESGHRRCDDSRKISEEILQARQ